MHNYTPWLKASIPKNKCLADDDALTVYFNANDTKTALHIPTNHTSKWGMCSPIDGWKYTWNIKAS